MQPRLRVPQPRPGRRQLAGLLTLRGPEPDATERRWELGATGHVAAGTQLAERLCEQIRAWDRDRTAQPVITAYPAGTPDEELEGGLVIDKRFVRLVVSG